MPWAPGVGNIPEGYTFQQGEGYTSVRNPAGQSQVYRHQNGQTYLQGANGLQLLGATAPDADPSARAAAVSPVVGPPPARAWDDPGNFQHPLNTIDGIIERMDAANRQARGANEQRYNQALDLSRATRAGANNQLNETGGIYSGIRGQTTEGYDAARRSLETQGNAARDQIERGRVSSNAEGDQELARRGLYNSSIAASNRNRTREGADRSLNDLNERVAAQRSGLEERATQASTAASANLGQFMERRAGVQAGLNGNEMGLITGRTDEYPGLGGIANLLTQQQIAQQQQAAANAQRRSSQFGSIGTLLGAGIGTLVAPGVGTLIGAGLGGAAGNIAGGGGGAGYAGNATGGLALLGQRNQAPPQYPGSPYYGTPGTEAAYFPR